MSIVRWRGERFFRSRERSQRIVGRRWRKGGGCQTRPYRRSYAADNMKLDGGGQRGPPLLDAHLPEGTGEPHAEGAVRLDLGEELEKLGQRLVELAAGA